jgi:hypothetical protein
MADVVRRDLKFIHRLGLPIRFRLNLALRDTGTSTAKLRAPTRKLIPTLQYTSTILLWQI